MPSKKNTKYLSLLVLFFTFTFGFSQNTTKFKVVLDAGHGGKDPGAVKNGIKEKDVVLDVVLKIGKILEKNKNIEVIYTRKTDIFIGLRERANIANKAKANLFISVHCNGVKSTSARGTETFVSGFGRLAEQDAAVRENASILLEKDYKDNYEGFDPKDPESYIIFSLMKNVFREQSIKLASLMQDEYVKSGRVNRGVQEKSLAVLARAGMPAVLTEIGFISNPEEEKFMNSAEGQAEIVKNILDAIIAYKKQIEI